ncbi:MAG: presqualene diphosphate synthase HpnD [Caulobacteraceae bacterium]
MTATLETASEPANVLGASEAARASGSSFYAAMRLMPRARREAMFAIYGFCRQVDDIADDEGPTREERRSALEIWREHISALFAGQVRTPTAPLAEPAVRFELQEADFQAVIDGMAMDVDRDIRAPAYDELDLYCDRVASAVGRLSVNVFGMERGRGVELAHHLGRALQLTNILRDLDEDAAMGRLYVPAEALKIGEVETDDPLAVLAHPGLDPACRFLARKAHGHYQAADRIMAIGGLGALRTPRLMSAVYAEILRRMEIAGWSAPRQRVKIGRTRLAWLIVSRGLIG